jgi:glycine/D-amino acid oxidase-like deaminating enzyme
VVEARVVRDRSPIDGAVDPVAVTEALVDEARRHGAQLRLTETVRGLRVRNHAVVGADTSTGTIAAGAVVLAAGIDAPALCAPLDLALPIAASPAVLIAFNAPPGMVRTVRERAGREVRQTAAGA